MSHKCPKCGTVLEIGIRLTAAPPMQADTVKANDIEGQDLGELLASVPDNINDYERKFIADLTERYEQFGDRTQMSKKQWRILGQILDKRR